MTKQQESDRLYDLIAPEPGHWLEHGQGLRLAARPIFARLMKIGHSNTPRSQIRVEMLGCVQGWMLLQAAAFENLLKAIAACRGLISINGDSVQRDQAIQARGGHGLSEIANKLQVDMTPQEAGLLRRLEEYLTWAGRYPVPLKKRDYTRAHADNFLRLNETDAKLTDTLADRLTVLASQRET